MGSSKKHKEKDREGKKKKKRRSKSRSRSRDRKIRRRDKSPPQSQVTERDRESADFLQKDYIFSDDDSRFRSSDYSQGNAYERSRDRRDQGRRALLFHFIQIWVLLYIFEF